MEKLIVYVCSPYRGNVEKNVEKAKEYCRMITLLGHIPFCPHIYFTQFLDDNRADERELALSQNLYLLKKCDCLVVFGDTVSEGMKREIDEAKNLNIPILYFDKAIKKLQEVVNSVQ